jgi:hypothetical protein
MVLADIGVAKSELVGKHDLRKVFLVGLGGAGVRAKAVGKNAEFHSPILNMPAAAH